jgi:dihydrofolate reductase
VSPLALVVAMSRNRVIGRDGDLPWRYPEDLRHFKRTTTGHAIIMGRKTYDSIGRALPGRRNLVVSRDPELVVAPGVEVASSLEAALAMARETDPCPMVIGGSSLYAAALPLATRLYVTEIDRELDGDAFFPELPDGVFREIERRPGETPELTFVTLDRR